MFFKTYWENRQLRREVEKLDRDVSYHRGQAEDADRKRREHARRVTELEAKLAKAEKDITKLKALVRQQTGADLLVNALCELGVIPKPEKDYDAFERQNALLQQMTATRAANYGQGQFNPQHQGLANLLGGVR